MTTLGIAGKRLLVTGGASGIGLGVVRLALAEKAQVGVITRRQSSVEALRDATGHDPACVAVRGDVTDPTQLRNAVDELAQQMGGVDIVVTCAGVDGVFGNSVEGVSPGEFREVLDTNVVGTFATVQAALPYLRRSLAPCAVLIGSDSGFVSAPGMVPYIASKGAVRQLTQALSLELFGDMIRVNSVCPSVVDTPMARRDLGIDSFDEVGYPVQTVDEVTWTVLMLASPRSRAVNGVSLLSDFGYSGRSSFPA
ncbi:dihydroanticapsin dehydrogenase [Propionibacterium cyclohexanicum]|uniref:Dihydroanticapsin dehydrogenase n=1 Tax=Propionibacterium cyclohexanicum TaxID=64702 RepID=A0A1H9Q199_9ACTN|nr:SDR family oxidoreductase [Propionibacterium cyclohexanicum]SER53845.1 dihydroanticapsin dehydrogenase [Propionibacterium cyclohexanicum]